MRKYNVAIADDDEFILDLVARIVKRDPDTTLVGLAKDGEGLLEVVKNNNVDIVIADLFMPKIDGLGVISIIKSDMSIKNKPFCIVSSFMKDEMIIQRSFDIGADYYLMKPFHKAMVSEIIKLTKSKINKETNFPIIYDKNYVYDKATSILKELGLPAHMKGYNLLRNAICMCIDDPKMLEGVTKILYPELSKNIGKNATPSSAERAMRYAIETIFTKGNIDYITKIFGYRSMESDRPSVTEFIATITDYIIINSNKKIK